MAIKEVVEGSGTGARSPEPTALLIGSMSALSNKPFLTRSCDRNHVADHTPSDEVTSDDANDVATGSWRFNRHAVLRGIVELTPFDAEVARTGFNKRRSTVLSDRVTVANKPRVCNSHSRRFDEKQLHA